MPYYVDGKKCYGTHEIAKKVNNFLKIKKEVDTDKGKKIKLIPLFIVSRKNVYDVLEKYYSDYVIKHYFKYGICYDIDSIEHLMFGENSLTFFDRLYKAFCQTNDIKYDARVYHELRGLIKHIPPTNNNHSTFEDESKRAKENLERIRKEPIKYRNSTDDDEDQFQSRDFENDNDAYSNYLIKTKYQESINRNKKIYITEEKFLRLFKNKLL